VSYAPLHPERWWRAPGRLLRVLLDRRTIVPFPATYLMAAATGAALGVALQFLLHWPWWAVGLGFVAVVWLFFLSSALWGPRNGHRDLLTEAVMAVSPSRGQARWERREERLFRSPPFPLLGLDSSWTGSRLICGMRSRSGGVDSMELCHGNSLLHQGPHLRVEVSTAEGRPCVDDLARAVFELLRRPSDLSPDEAEAWWWRKEKDIRSRKAAWTRVAIPVDGRAVEFDFLAEGTDWVAQASRDDLIVRLRAHDFPLELVRLETIADVEPYIEGRRRDLEEARRAHEQPEFPLS
jgi:hypothetical protein